MNFIFVLVTKPNTLCASVEYNTPRYRSLAWSNAVFPGTAAALVLATPGVVDKLHFSSMTSIESKKFFVIVESLMAPPASAAS